MVSTAALLSVALSFPALRASGSFVKPYSRTCDISNVAITNLPSGLMGPTYKTSFVSVAIGIQNYTCSSAGKYTNIGAVAELFDISCLYGTPTFADIQDSAIRLWEVAPAHLTAQDIIANLHSHDPAVLGQHYFIPHPTGTGLDPVWDFSSEGATAGNADAIVVAAKTGNVTAPTGSQDVDWLSLNGVKGGLAQQVYRTDTRLGQPPASCSPGSPDISVKYASKYYFFGGSIHSTGSSSMTYAPPSTMSSALPSTTGNAADPSHSWAPGPVDHKITVGANGQLAYYPANITAAPGDTVTFEFHQKNHTVTQSNFGNPCVPLDKSTGKAGFKSGFQFVADSVTSNFPTFQIKINDTAPVWGYCGQTGHCAAGMVFSINANETSANSFEAFQKLAKATGGASAAPPSTQPTTHKITVGANGQLAYNPSNITAAIGDKVVFEFHQKNHTVTQSNFANPCVPLQQSTGKAGFKSGFRPVPDSLTSDFPTFEVTVEDNAPIWGYCGQTGHCSAGMVFSINANESSPNTFDAFQKLAKQTAGSGSAPPSAGKPVDHKITVGANGQLSYYPANITAAPGDTVTFEFHQKNHTVTQSNFANPCVPLDKSTGKAGFKSGFRPVPDSVTSDFPTYTITVNDTSPVWGYCGQTGHCSAGMVFSINANEASANSFEAFQKLAKATGGSSATPPSQPTTHKITVGANGQLAYYPSNITAAIGDKVVFEFHQKNHTVTQSNFANPCVPLDKSTGKTGFKSGFRPVPDSVTSDFPTFEVTVTDKSPIWGYCGQTNHCASGMVFSINADESSPNTFAAFQNLAKNTTKTETPPPQSAQPTTHKITVGANGQLAYYPSNITANIGDKVVFEFHQKNHTVTQSNFANPCVPLDQSTGKTGFKSGFRPVPDSLTSDFPTFEVTVMDKNPIWGYCGQTNHCASGMVFSINADESSPNTFAAFQNLAKNTPKTETPPPAANPVDHKITVGANGQLSYYPASITAAPGDTVTFEFHPKNHTVTQSNFANPCVPLQQSTGQVGFKSGFKPVSDWVTDFPTYQIKVEDTNPIWGYCGQTGHCAAGMVFSINAPTSGANTFDAFQSLAKQTGGK